MVRMRSLIPIGAAVVVSGVLTVACSSGPAVPADPTLAKGQQVYNASCASCHGVRGEGGTAPRLIGVASTYPDIQKQISVITNGIKGSTMPAWKDSLSAEEINAVAQYTRTLSD